MNGLKSAVAVSAIPKCLIPPHVEALKPYQPGRPPDELKKHLGIERFINLASNENPFGPSTTVVAAIQKAFSDLCRYPDSGNLNLRSALAERFKVSVNNVAVGNGSESILSNILRAFLHDKDEVLTSQGTFIGLRVLVQSQGVQLNTIPLKNYGFDLAAISDAININTKIIYLCNPNNPTGTIFNRLEFERFMNHVPEQVLVILDEAYYEFAAHVQEFPDSMIYSFDNIITLRTFSKAYGLAGLRLGYALGHEYLIDFVNRIKLPFEPSILAQTAGLAALADEDYLRRTLENNRIGMVLLADEIDKLGLKTVQSYANFVMVDLGSTEKVTKLHQAVLSKGIAIRPLAAFGLPTCFRVTIGLPEENELFIQTLKNLL